MGLKDDPNGRGDVDEISAGTLLVSSEEVAASRGRLLLEGFMDDIQGVE